MSTKKHKITKSELKYYTKFVALFAKELGINNWEISVDIDKEVQNNRAYVLTATGAKTALIYLVENWDYKPKWEELRLIAFHEVCEILLSEINDKLNYIYSDRETARMIHSVIRTLENVLLPLIEKKYDKKRMGIKK